MTRHLLIAFNGPAPGADVSDVEKWYEEVHLADIRSVTGVKSARRYKIVRGHVPGRELWPFVAVYEIEVDDLAAIQHEFGEKASVFHPGLDRSTSMHVFATQTAGDD